jgi:hypothetical protein
LHTIQLELVDLHYRWGILCLSEIELRSLRSIKKCMIVNESQYRLWIVEHGVGQKDRVASSPDSYISYLNSVSKSLGEDISPSVLSSEADVDAIAARITDKAVRTVQNYKTAMHHYVEMVKSTQ